ncbi:MAG TPA: ABC transporter permease, partial [Ktedonobacter sp.]|nr:ABC transporter permease [Ktedonobacter sp.]
MAQVYVPDNPREREQLQGGTGPLEEKHRRRHTSRRLGFIDLTIFLAFIAIVTFLVAAAARWSAPLTPQVAISFSPTVLPLYAAYSLLRMMLGYLLSLIFTLVYGHVAA